MTYGGMTHGGMTHDSWRHALSCMADLYNHALAQTTAAHLLQRGRTTMTVLVRSTGLRTKQVRDALFALIQHNLVTYAIATATTAMSKSANGRRAPAMPPVHYALDVERALSIVRYPRAVVLCREMYSEAVCFAR